MSDEASVTVESYDDCVWIWGDSPVMKNTQRMKLSHADARELLRLLMKADLTEKAPKAEAAA